MNTLRSNATVHPSGNSRLLMGTKRAVDVLLAGGFFLVLGWAFALVWIGVLLTSGKPGIYKQPRYGRDGRVFSFYKFRTMVPDADAVLERYLRGNEAARRQWEMYQKLDRDPRITRFGAVLRKYSLDELPQFWNVLKGDMSVVGPRPCMFAQKELYGVYWSSYCAVRPGITGLWQVSGRNEISYRRRAAMDADYVATLSIRQDIAILLKTFLVVAGARGSR
ncbi:lipopolysaccharide/colanic/teichoic acid biosynthesis glycosyltransferase [Variovorax beijingensis]|uniref:Lipopolysaccharide/colanic/teichoic acid biosynthesis glycosyltransferase n=2 Tax=Variovorax TaxID=34072 RepID=A0AAE3XZH6_VARPD|nr:MULTISPECIES: sugar transferase [Variovorax]MBD9664194.1 sugar transferase [Variovorax sp. VRV01]MDP9965137.1 lipopolysaccharide/colanic/teichoic acid biosynthesis glycosyltransferase [Variovorax paradoxus]MDR6428428.1 lipopolysaccharide/colanic/teichoic acid biosynthesis glycosyltransferase [Variovorax paradoxus]MDR6455081.1 lipopolysaccharide/colanic/teichoic acid biosynthesis glycosyltransferase [Variovorax paradoxus]TWD85077.1 lipopolysaccharide/colanic/teichoic acid biosynthesis glycos